MSTPGVESNNDGEAAKLARARGLCATLGGGWRTEQIEIANGSYLELGNQLGVGIVECDTRRAVWLPHVAAARIDPATNRARRLGAPALLGAREDPAGWRCVIARTEAGEIAPWRQKSWQQ